MHLIYLLQYIYPSNCMHFLQFHSFKLFGAFEELNPLHAKPVKYFLVFCMHFTSFNSPFYIFLFIIYSLSTLYAPQQTP